MWTALPPSLLETKSWMECELPSLPSNINLTIPILCRFIKGIISLLFLLMYRCLSTPLSWILIIFVNVFFINCSLLSVSVSYFQLNNFLLCVRESSIVCIQRLVQLESYNLFLYNVIFFFNLYFLFCSPSLNSFELHLLSYEFIQTWFVELRIHSNFICRVTNSFKLHLSSYEFIRTSFVELRIHSNFICRVTNSFELHLSSYELLLNSKNST